MIQYSVLSFGGKTCRNKKCFIKGFKQWPLEILFLSNRIKDIGLGSILLNYKCSFNLVLNKLIINTASCKSYIVDKLIEIQGGVLSSDDDEDGNNHNIETLILSHYHPLAFLTRDFNLV